MLADGAELSTSKPSFDAPKSWKIESILFFESWNRFQRLETNSEMLEPIGIGYKSKVSLILELAFSANVTPEAGRAVIGATEKCPITVAPTRVFSAAVMSAVLQSTAADGWWESTCVGSN